MNSSEIVGQLEKLKYFKYIPEIDKADFKMHLEEQINNGWFNMPSQAFLDYKRTKEIQANTIESIDQRSLMLDGAFLFRGGLESSLEKFKSIFEARGLQFDLTPIAIQYSGTENKHIKHDVIVNGRPYNIFNDVGERGVSEITYTKSVFNLLNEELKCQNYNEERFIVITSIETLQFMLVDKKINNFITQISNEFNFMNIDLNQY